MSNALENLENLLTKKQTKPIKKGNSGALQNLLNLHSTTRKKKTPTDKPRRVVYQRDKNGNRSYPYSGQQRKLVKNEHTKRSGLYHILLYVCMFIYIYQTLLVSHIIIRHQMYIAS